VLGGFLNAPAVELSGADIMRLTGLASGSLYPILYAFEDTGLLASRWEVEDPRALGRPRRRLYQITPLGEQTAREAAAEFAKLLLPTPVPGEL
jgi:DNA-binding PadR family transcriptional regulator